MQYAEEQDEVVRAQLRLLSDDDWEHIPCPMLAFSDQWGVLTEDVLASWLSGASDITLDAKRVLLDGNGGLRLSSWATLAGRGRLKPPQRVQRLFDAETGEDVAGQRFCVPSDSGVADADETLMFPMAKLVQATVPVEACSSYVVEAIRLHMLREHDPEGTSVAS
eukprot:1546875-Rhodomonas_salina.1